MLINWIEIINIPYLPVELWNQEEHVPLKRGLCKLITGFVKKNVTFDLAVKSVPGHLEPWFLHIWIRLTCGFCFLFWFIWNSVQNWYKYVIKQHVSLTDKTKTGRTIKMKTVQRKRFVYQNFYQPIKKFKLPRDCCVRHDLVPQLHYSLFVLWAENIHG